jgi:RNA polymerase sigma-70 factor (TIGR02960 family)
MTRPHDPADLQWLSLARAGDSRAFDRVVAPYRRLLHTHCYRMLGSPHDADDALQETLIAAWRGVASFDGRSALSTWLYQISTHVCLRLISKRPRRMESPDYGPALETTADLGQMVTGPVWLEPLPDDEAPWHGEVHEDPAEAIARRESVALAFAAALQHLPGTQRAVLLLRDVLGYSAAEVARTLGTTVAAANSALQRAQKTVKDKMPARSQAAELQSLGQGKLDKLLSAFVTAWESREIEELVRLFTEDVRFKMPPLPAWFDGRAFVEKFIVERVFETSWRLLPLRANAQAGFACYMKRTGDDRFRLGAITLVSLRAGQIAGLHSFLDPVVHRRFGLAEEILDGAPIC